MDQLSDFGKFQRLMRRLCETMNKPITDELVESWWKALRTVQFSEVERRFDNFLDRATETTRFPRPSQFRPENIVVHDAKDEARDRRIGEENRRNWQRFIERYPTTGPIRYKLAQCAQLVANTPENSPAYAEAVAEEFALLRMLGEHGRFAEDR